MKKHKSTLKAGKKIGGITRTQEGEPVNYLTPDNWFEWVKNNKPSVFEKLSKHTPQAELGKLLWGWRLTAGRTQKDQAKRSGCSMATYQKLEEVSTNSNPNYLTLYKIARSYGVSFKEFWDGPGHKNYST